jgi:hypothetical protein
MIRLFNTCYNIIVTGFLTLCTGMRIDILYLRESQSKTIFEIFKNVHKLCSKNNVVKFAKINTFLQFCIFVLTLRSFYP